LLAADETIGPSNFLGVIEIRTIHRRDLRHSE
jgi:hypothetical protein